MQLYEVCARGTAALSIFASSYDHAVQIYMMWWLCRHEMPLPDIEVKERDARWRGLDTRGLNEVLASKVAGVGHFDPGHGWMVLDPTAGSAGAGGQRP